MEKEYRQMLSMYDDEFEDGTEALKEQAKQVRAFAHACLGGYPQCCPGQSRSIHMSAHA